jgi:hypothetical protein
VAALLAIVLALALQTSPESFWEGLAARRLEDQLALEERPEVDLRSEGTFSSLSGSFSGGTVLLRNPRLEGLSPRTVAIDLEPFDVDVLRSVASGAIRAEGPVPGTLEIELAEGEVRRLAREGAQDFALTDLQLDRGRAVVGSEVALFGSVLPVSVEGGAEVRNGALNFEPSQVTAAGVPLPEDLNAVVLENASFEYPLELPLEGGRITGGKVLRDRLLLTGEVEDLLSAELAGA